MLPIPNKYRVATGSSEGSLALSAFDKALLEANIGNLNLVRITSILPPLVQEDPELQPPYGALVPTAYGAFTSENPGDIISAAVGLGFSRDHVGVIMEAAGCCPRQESEEKVQKMLEEAFASRHLTLDKTIIKGVQHRVGKTGAVIAAVILWSAP